MCCPSVCNHEICRDDKASVAKRHDTDSCLLPSDHLRSAAKWPEETIEATARSSVDSCVHVMTSPQALRVSRNFSSILPTSVDESWLGQACHCETCLNAAVYSLQTAADETRAENRDRIIASRPNALLQDCLGGISCLATSFLRHNPCWLASGCFLQMRGFLTPTTLSKGKHLRLHMQRLGLFAFAVSFATASCSGRGLASSSPSCRQSSSLVHVRF